MTIKSSGPLGISDINAEFGLGNNLGAYRGHQWVNTSGGVGNFTSGPIDMNQFYNTMNRTPPGSVTFSSPGNYTFTSPIGFQTMTVQIWAGGGAGGYPYNGGVTAGGGGGGDYSSWSIPAGSLNSTEPVVVGAGGYGTGNGNGAVAGPPGGWSMFGNAAYANGGYGGYGQNQGNIPGYTYSPTQSRPFTCTYYEHGAAGGRLIGKSYQFYGNGATWAGGGGAMGINYPDSGTGGPSTYGGAGGNFNYGWQLGNGIPYADQCGRFPAGGGGGATASLGTWTSGSGGNGQVIITWT